MTSKIFRSTVFVAALVLLLSLSVILGVLYNHFTDVQVAQLKDEQLDIEADFYLAMGDMLRDGYWADNNYAPGQEEYLY